MLELLQNLDYTTVSMLTRLKNNPKTAGVLLIVLSAIGYGLQPIFGKLAYADGVSPATLTFGRFLLATIFYINRSG